METRNLASRLDEGSSIKKIGASRTIARPKATRWRCPQIKQLVYVVDILLTLKYQLHAIHVFLSLLLEYLRNLSPKAMLS